MDNGALQTVRVCHRGGQAELPASTVSTVPVMFRPPSPRRYSTMEATSLASGRRRNALRPEANDVASMVEYLLGEGGRNITGTVLTVDAGNTASPPRRQACAVAAHRINHCIDHTSRTAPPGENRPMSSDVIRAAVLTP